MYDYDLLAFLEFHINKEEDYIHKLNIELSQAKPKSKLALGLVDSISFHEGALTALEMVYNKVRYNEE